MSGRRTGTVPGDEEGSVRTADSEATEGFDGARPPAAAARSPGQRTQVVELKTPGMCQASCDCNECSVEADYCLNPKHAQQHFAPSQGVGFVDLLRRIQLCRQCASRPLREVVDSLRFKLRRLRNHPLRPIKRHQLRERGYCKMLLDTKQGRHFLNAKAWQPKQPQGDSLL
jgi:hypothetical protein